MNEREDIQKQLEALFESHFGQAPASFHWLPQAGSNRLYARLAAGDTTVIGTYSGDKKENSTFIYFSSIFKKAEVAVPEVFAVSANKSCYLQEDFGDTTLFDLVLREGFSPEVISLYKQAIDGLIQIQWIAGKSIDFSMCFGASQFNRNQVLSDLLYFKYYFADLQKPDYDRLLFLEEMESWSSRLASVQPQTFMYRDFQSRNIMVKDGGVCFVDYQGGMAGPPQYDLASFLWQARAKVPAPVKNELLNYYLDALHQVRGISKFDEIEFRRVYLECVLLRMLQTLGAYGFRGLQERKEHFLKSIYPALQQLAAFLEDYPQTLPYPELGRVLTALTKPERMEAFKDPDFPEGRVQQLNITIYSFSYKKGLPADTSGHGGGFVFDCRGLLNPGRFEEYKALTGKEESVIRFLKEKTRVAEFLDPVYALVDLTVENYLKRGFDHLSVAFGCTGGQHRSVYCAEALRDHLQEKYGLAASVLHMEQDVHTHGRR